MRAAVIDWMKLSKTLIMDTFMLSASKFDTKWPMVKPVFLYDIVDLFDFDCFDTNPKCYLFTNKLYR